jgi:hypothetical protein
VPKPVPGSSSPKASPGPINDGATPAGTQVGHGPGGNIAPGNPGNQNPQRGGSNLPSAQVGVDPMQSGSRPPQPTGPKPAQQ